MPNTIGIASLDGNDTARITGLVTMKNLLKWMRNREKSLNAEYKHMQEFAKIRPMLMIYGEAVKSGPGKILREYALTHWPNLQMERLGLMRRVNEPLVGAGKTLTEIFDSLYVVAAEMVHLPNLACELLTMSKHVEDNLNHPHSEKVFEALKADSKDWDGNVIEKHAAEWATGKNLINLPLLVMKQYAQNGIEMLNTCRWLVKSVMTYYFVKHSHKIQLTGGLQGVFENSTISDEVDVSKSVQAPYPMNYIEFAEPIRIDKPTFRKEYMDENPRFFTKQIPMIRSVTGALIYRINTVVTSPDESLLNAYKDVTKSASKRRQEILEERNEKFDTDLLDDDVIASTLNWYIDNFPKEGCRITGDVVGLKYKVDDPIGETRPICERAYFPVSFNNDNGKEINLKCKIPNAGYSTNKFEIEEIPELQNLADGDNKLAAYLEAIQSGQGTDNLNFLLSDETIESIYSEAIRNMWKYNLISTDMMRDFNDNFLAAYPVYYQNTGVIKDREEMEDEEFLKKHQNVKPLHLDPIQANKIQSHHYYEYVKMNRKNQDYIVIQLMVETKDGESQDVFIELGRREDGDKWGRVKEDFIRSMGPEREHLTEYYIEALELTLQSLWFINEPEVELVKAKMPMPSTKRFKERKMNTKKAKKIVLTGKKKVYINNIEKALRSNPSHAFWVKGHWRNQWYSSLQEHQRKWIMPYVKGTSKGLVPKKQVDLIDLDSKNEA